MPDPIDHPAKQSEDIARLVLEQPDFLAEMQAIWVAHGGVGPMPKLRVSRATYKCLLEAGVPEQLIAINPRMPAR